MKAKQRKRTMAERGSKTATVYRSVSFKKLGSWSSNRSEEQQHKSEDSEAAGVALPPEPSKDEQPLATRNVSVSRKVSKISATTAGLPTADPKRGSSAHLASVSPSIRQLTEKFSSRSTHGASPGDGAAVTRGSSTFPRARGSRKDGSPDRKSFHEDSGGGYFQDSDSPTTATAGSLTDSKVLKFASGTDSVSGSDTERESKKRIFRHLSTDSSSSSGKRDYSQINTCASDHRKTLSTDEEEDVTARLLSPPCKSHRRYHGDFIPLHSDKWPSVTKIRQLFDERQKKARQQQHKTKADHLKSATRGHPHKFSPTENVPFLDRDDQLLPHSCSNEASDLSYGKCIVGSQSREYSTAKQTFRFGMDFNLKADHQQYSNDEEADTETLNDKVSSYAFLSRSRSSRSHTGSIHYCRINSSPYRSQSPSTPTTTGLTSDPNPDFQPAATWSWRRSVSLDTSLCSSSLQQPTVRERRDRQGVGLPRDSLHSSHSSSKAPAPTSFSASAPDKAVASSSTVAPSTELRHPAKVTSSLSSHWRFSSGDEEEEHNKRRRGVGWSVPFNSAPFNSLRGGERGTTDRGSSYLSRSKNGWWAAKGIGRSSGSEEDSPGSLGPHSREAVRRRSLRKKKTVIGAALTGCDDYNDQDGESEDSDSDTALTMEHLERHPQQKARGESLTVSHLAKEPLSHSNRARVQQWERISSSVTSATLPGVSRVSKVNIPPFVSSPGGSRCSSRYSSTETLKEEDQVNCSNRAANVLFNTGGVIGCSSRTASSCVLSKTYHGNFTMYRSPSFGHGDNFSRAPVRVRPKIVPTVISSPSVLTREGETGAGVRSGDAMSFRRTAGGNAVNENDKNQISTSNPDITSETMTLLSFLKSDLSELKVRKTNGGDKPAVVDGPSVYRMGLRTHGGTIVPSGRRPSLKDLTATLRRAKSFTYPEKPTTTIRSHLTGRTAVRSSSEQQLDLDGEKDGGRVLVSDREVESDGGDFRVGRGQRMREYGFDDEEEEVMPTPLQERYVQEARQVIRDICQMSTKDNDFDDLRVKENSDNLKDICLQDKKTRKEKENTGVGVKDEARADEDGEFKSMKDGDKHDKERESRERERSERDGQSMQLEKLNSRSTEYKQKTKRQSRETDRALLKGESEECMFYDRSVDELSGHESSLTDEGIVTEPETGPSDPSDMSFLVSGVNLGSRAARDGLVQSVAIWKQSALHEVEGFKQEREDIAESSVSCTNQLNEVSGAPSLLFPSHMEESDRSVMDLTTPAGINNINSNSEEINANSAVSQGPAATAGGGGLDAPATPSALRRRRKFSPSGNNNTGSDSSNGSNAESSIAAVGNVESIVYRSLSDPMPQRRCSVAEEGNNNFCSVDSNLLGSLSVKGGGGASDASTVTTLSEYKGSVASDLSVCSDGGLRDDGVRDYSGVIRSIVAEPGAMDRLMTDDHGNGKAHKKKSFSDPSRRSDAPLLQNDSQFKSHSGSSQPINELDQIGQIPPSSSEPILSEQREELWQSEVKTKHGVPTQPLHQANSGNIVKKPCSQSECAPYSANHQDEDDDDVIDQDAEVKEQELSKFSFDVKLAEVLSPRMVRRPSRKRPNRLAHFFPHEGPFETQEPNSEGQEDQSDETDLTPPLPPPPLQSKPKTRPKHVRHASEPASFIPISPPPQLQPLKEVDFLTPQPTAEPPVLTKSPGDETPSLEDVTQKYILELSTAEKDIEGPGPLPAPRDGPEALLSTSEGSSETSSSGITEGGPQKKSTENSPQRTKPRVVSSDTFTILPAVCKTARFFCLSNELKMVQLQIFSAISFS